MEATSSRSAKRVETLVTVVCGALILGSLIAVAWMPVRPGFSTESDAAGRQRVVWVAPDAPAWNVGVRPGDTVARRTERGEATKYLFTSPDGRRIILDPGLAAPKLLDLLMGGLGLSLLLLGHLVLKKGRDRTMSAAFWRLSLLASVGLGLVSAARHGLPWALTLDFVSIRLFGPALVEFALAVPRMGSKMGLRMLLWLPALALIAIYPLCWLRPDSLFPPVQAASYTMLAGYCSAACFFMGLAVTQRSLSASHREQLMWLCVGLGGGIAPFTLLTLLPLVLTGRAIVPGELSILALVLLPMCVSVAVARTEFMGIASLVRRRTLRVLLGVAAIAIVASVTGWLAAVGPERWGWSAPSIAIAASVVTFVSFAVLWPRIYRRVERLMVNDAYDTEDAVLRVSASIAQARPEESAEIAVAHARSIMDVSFAFLFTPDREWWCVHPRSEVNDTLRDTVAYHAHALLEAPLQAGASTQEETNVRFVREQTVLFLPVSASRDKLAILCMGPKRSEGTYTLQDRSLLSALCYQLALKLQEQNLQIRMTEQGAELRALRGDGEPLTAREMEVLSYAAQGLENKEIARKLVLHTRTVEKRFTSIFRKWGVHNRQEAVHIARRRGLI